MPHADWLDPYAGNVLVSGLGPILSPEAALAWLTDLPPVPGSLAQVPRHIRLHLLMAVRGFHLPPLIERQLAQTVDVMVRQGYVKRDPALSGTWSVISGEAARLKRPGEPAMAASVAGLSGVGKTEACLRCINRFPRQVILHETFPRLVGGLQQVVWLSVEIPPSGKASDLARALMTAWDRATGGNRFAKILSETRIRDPMGALEEWRQVAASHFLGILHLDEVQNFFKLSSIKQRKSRQGTSDAPALSIVEDQCLRWVLNLTNTGQIPLLVSGTPDGMDALSRRLSTLGRLNVMGYHPFAEFSDPTDPAFVKMFLGTLSRYQYMATPLTIDEGIARLIVELTGGIQRHIIALWVAAHRVALERSNGDDLRIDDFVTAANTWLAPLAPAVAALRSKDPQRMALYEDLRPRDTAFWANFWGKVQVP
jgi:hypothetical protein